ncbi:MAG: mechanosensitive ion channel family protein [Nitrospiraceae bacterium]
MMTFFETALLAPLEQLGRQLLAVLPNIMAMAIIIGLGFVVAWGLGHTVERLLRVVRLDHLCNRLGINAALMRGGVKSDPSYLFGRAVYWTIVAFATIAGLGALNLQPVNQFAQSFLAYIPHILTAAVIVVVGYLLSNFIAQAVLIAAVNASLPPARLIAVMSRWGVQLFALAMALEELGIAASVVVVGFGITFGGIVFATGLAFGLGAKDLAKEYLERMLSNRARDRAPDDLRHL